MNRADRFELTEHDYPTRVIYDIKTETSFSIEGGGCLYLSLNRLAKAARISESQASNYCNVATVNYFKTRLDDWQ